MRAIRIAAVLPVLALFSVLPIGAAFADGSTSPSPSPSASASASAPPTVAGTSFDNATPIEQGQQATAGASTGDYMYWTFAGDTGQNITVHATVTFPASATRQGASTWQVDVYDGLRRRQACRYGVQTKTAAATDTSVDLSCTLRTVVGYADPWSNDPLRGAYYIRLTAIAPAASDLGLPVTAAVKATSTGTDGAQAVDGSVVPLVSADAPSVEPADGWASTWWSARWPWTAGGGALGALAGVGGYALTRGRGRGRPRNVPQGNVGQSGGPYGNGQQGSGPQGNVPQGNGPQGNGPQGYNQQGY